MSFSIASDTEAGLPALCPGQRHDAASGGVLGGHTGAATLPFKCHMEMESLM